MSRSAKKISKKLSSRKRGKRGSRRTILPPAMHMTFEPVPSTQVELGAPPTLRSAGHPLASWDPAAPTLRHPFANWQPSAPTLRPSQ